MNVYIIGGPNGAGKTTAASYLMPTHIKSTEYVNADRIAETINPLHPEFVAMDAGRPCLAESKNLQTCRQILHLKRQWLLAPSHHF